MQWWAHDWGVVDLMSLQWPILQCVLPTRMTNTASFYLSQTSDSPLN